MLVSFFVGEKGIILLNHLEEVPDFSLLTIGIQIYTFFPPPAVCVIINSPSALKPSYVFRDLKYNLTLDTVNFVPP